MDREARRAAIAVPVYRAELTVDEQTSLRHLEHFLGRHDCFLVMPKSLRFALDGYGVKRFPDRFLESRRGYSALMLSRRFYEAFADYEYLLVYQLDCLVFSDELLDWCERGYDYLGAPHRMGDRPPMPGNGGFSLRRIPSFLAVLSSKRKTVDPDEYWARTWAAKPALTRLRNLPKKHGKRLRTFNGVGWEVRQTNRAEFTWTEDWFWSLQATHYVPQFRLAPCEEGARFAFGEEPEKWFEAAGRRLPFGCHGWSAPERRAFWEPYLLRA